MSDGRVWLIGHGGRRTALVGTTLALVACVSLVAGSFAALGQTDAAPAISGLIDAGVDPDLRWPRFSTYQDALRRAYEPGGFAPLWVRDGAPSEQALEVIELLATADVNGLDASDYDAGRLSAEAHRLRAAEQRGGDELGRFDVALSLSLLRFVSDSAVGRIDPRRLGFDLDPDASRIDLPALLLELATSSHPRERLAEFDAPPPASARLQGALVQYRALAARTDLPPVPVLPKLHPGESDPGLPALRARLIAYGDLPADAPRPQVPAHYDPVLVQAVKHFQRRHGLDPDGVIGTATKRALAVLPAQRVRQIELAMERARWLPSQLPERFLVINIPEFRLRGYAGGEPVPRVDMQVIVGSAEDHTETPVLRADMRYLIFRPYWLVPPSIAHKEILPKAERDAAYLGRENMEIVNGRVRQRPGPNNSLGLLKFILPNPYHVYLHDTPAKALFRRTRRDFSHGCIRVADPAGLAEFVLAGQAGWNRDRIVAAMKSGTDNHHVDLVSPVPVYVVYATAVVEPDGQVEFFDDIYGHDATLDALLTKGHSHSS